MTLAFEVMIYAAVLKWLTITVGVATWRLLVVQWVAITVTPITAIIIVSIMGIAPMRILILASVAKNYAIYVKTHEVCVKILAAFGKIQEAFAMMAEAFAMIHVVCGKTPEDYERIHVV